MRAVVGARSVEIGIGDAGHLAHDRDEGNGVDEAAEQRDGERQAVGQGVVGVSLRPQAELVDEKRQAEDDRLDARISPRRPSRKVDCCCDEEGGGRAGERRAGEQEYHRVRPCAARPEKSPQRRRRRQRREVSSGRASNDWERPDGARQARTIADAPAPKEGRASAAPHEMFVTLACSPASAEPLAHRRRHDPAEPGVLVGLEVDAVERRTTDVLARVDEARRRAAWRRRGSARRGRATFPARPRTSRRMRSVAATGGGAARMMSGGAPAGRRGERFDGQRQAARRPARYRRGKREPALEIVAA